jgi:lytic starch monooxygenase
MALRGWSALVVAGLLPSTAGHGSLIVPPPRNSVDRSLPDWRGGKHTPSSPNAPGMPTIEPFGCDCVNGTEACESAQSCFWFSNGCTIGCSHCTGNGSRIFNNDICGSGLNATVTDPQHRTLNRRAQANTPEDVYRYNPWRRPGNAPSFDPCGMAGGQWTPDIAGAEYRTTVNAKMGDLGSKVLKKLPTGVVWERGGLAEVSIYIKTNHGVSPSPMTALLVP